MTDSCPSCLDAHKQIHSIGLDFLIYLTILFGNDILDYTTSHDTMRGVYPLDTQYYMYFTVRYDAHREIINVLSYCILRSTLI